MRSRMTSYPHVASHLRLLPPNALANGWAAFALTAFPTGKPRTAQYVRDGPRFLVGLGATDNLLPVETLSNQIASSRISQ